MEKERPEKRKEGDKEMWRKGALRKGTDARNSLKRLVMTFKPGLSETAETGRQVRTVSRVHAVRCKHSLAVRRTKGY